MAREFYLKNPTRHPEEAERRRKDRKREGGRRRRGPGRESAPTEKPSSKEVIRLKIPRGDIDGVGEVKRP